MSKNFIIIEPDPIVAIDVEGLLISQFPRAHITTGASLADIGPAIHNCGPDSTLFVRGTLVADDDNLRCVVQTVAMRRAQIVAIGGPFDFEFPATFIDLPFTTDMLLSAIMQGTPQTGLGASPAM